MQFAGKVVLVTGASSGIGAATAKQFARLGASLALTGRNLDNLNKVASECDRPANTPQPFIVPGDLTNEEDSKSLVESVIKHFGRLDVLVNNAGKS